MGQDHLAKLATTDTDQMMMVFLAGLEGESGHPIPQVPLLHNS